MWPVLLDMTKEESMQNLRKLELEAYAHLVDALRAQGPLSSDKKRLLKETSAVLNITQDRHKAEIRRAINDERLNTIAYHVTGVTESVDDWAQEGRRTVPIIPRMAPQTAYSAIADEAADNANQINKQLPLPACTERKRSQPLTSSTIPIQLPETSNKSLSFRIPEPPIRMEENKKRKLPICTDNSSLAQHLVGPPKISRTQQFYRQRTKALLRDHAKLKQETTKGLTAQSTKIPYLNGPKKPIFQNIQIPSTTMEQAETIEQIQNEINSYSLQKLAEQNHLPSTSQQQQSTTVTTLGGGGTTTTPTTITNLQNENQAPVKPKLLTNSKSINYKTNNPSSSCELQSKTLKVCPSSKKSFPSSSSSSSTMITKSSPLNQKLIVVSNAQTIPTSSILQKTLSIPLVKNLSIKNLEKFKIVTTNTIPANIHLATSTTTTTTTTTNSLKHKVVTVKTNPSSTTTTTTKKVIPLSQLINTKGGIKVLPLSGKIVTKTTSITTTTTTTGLSLSSSSSPLYITTTMGNLQKTTTTPSTIGTICCETTKTNGKSAVLDDILKASGVTSDDFDTKIQEYQIENNHFIIDNEKTMEHQNENSEIIISEQSDNNKSMMRVKPVRNFIDNLFTDDVDDDNGLNLLENEKDTPKNDNDDNNDDVDELEKQLRQLEEKDNNKQQEIIEIKEIEREQLLVQLENSENNVSETN